MTCLLDVPYLAEHIPLEQGLRPAINLVTLFCKRLAEHIPLEQGLRRTLELLNCQSLDDSQSIFH